MHLEPVDRNNWLDCAQLDLEPDQEKNLASNLKTIAEAKFEEHYVLRAIVKDDRVIGMLAYCPEVDEPTEGLYWLFRLMVDKAEQGKGYGELAVKEAIEEMKRRGAKLIRTMCRSDNLRARACYRGVGFKEAGSLEDGDRLFEMNV